jgi:hypothetical protein
MGDAFTGPAVFMSNTTRGDLKLGIKVVYGDREELVNPVFSLRSHGLYDLTLRGQNVAARHTNIDRGEVIHWVAAYRKKYPQVDIHVNDSDPRRITS